MVLVSKYSRECQHPAAGFNVVTGGYVRILSKERQKSKDRSEDKTDEVERKSNRSERRDENSGGREKAKTESFFCFNSGLCVKEGGKTHTRAFTRTQAPHMTCTRVASDQQPD